MPQSPRRNSQTQTNWTDQLSANRYAAGAAVAALLAAYVVAGRGEVPTSYRCVPSCLVIPRVDAAHSSSGPPPRNATRFFRGHHHAI